MLKVDQTDEELSIYLFHKKKKKKNKKKKITVLRSTYFIYKYIVPFFFFFSVAVVGRFQRPPHYDAIAIHTNPTTSELSSTINQREERSLNDSYISRKGSGASKWRKISCDLSK